MKIISIISFIFLAFVTSSRTQVALNIELKNGKNYIIPVMQIDSITYIQKESPCGTQNKIVYNGEVYPIVQIGSDCVFAENLRTSKFRNGDNIKSMDNETEFKESLEAAWMFPNFSYPNERFLGRLYNWNVVNDSRGVCPEGWKIPTITEWKALIEYIGLNNAGEKMKGFGKRGSDDKGWAHGTPDQNSSGFTALPAGYMHSEWGEQGFGDQACFWSSSALDDKLAEFFYIYSNSSYPTFAQTSKKSAMSIRCLKIKEVSGK